MKYKSILLVICILLSTNFVSAKENKEIDFLLSFVEASECTFIRNGKEYESKEARKHLEKKYNYAKSRIKSAEDFINRIATKSSMSKKPYHVRCQVEEVVLTSQWLAGALEAERKSK